MEDYNRFISEFLSGLEKELGDFSYRGLSVFGFIRIPIFILLKSRWSSGEAEAPSRPGVKIKTVNPLHAIKKALKVGGLFIPKIGKKISINKRGMTGFVIDYDFQAYIDMQLEIIDKLDRKSLFFFTQDSGLYKKIKERFPGQPVICPFHHVAISLRPRNVGLLVQLFKRSRQLSDGTLSFKLATCFYFLKAVSYVDFYESFLTKETFSSMVTLCDTHSHENIIANTAKRKGIKTFTLQHGFTCRFYAPVSSDRIFVWGSVSKKELMDLNVPEEKIVISGKLGFIEAWSKFTKNRQLYRSAFAQKFGFDPAKHIISFFPTRYSEAVNKARFANFARICELDINPLIRVRTREEIGKYETWLKEFQVRKNVPIHQGGDLFEVLNASDILVTTESSVGVEALPFSVIVVLLDIFDNIDLKHWITNYSDSLVVKNGDELYSLVKRIIADEEYCKAKKKSSFQCSDKYFQLMEMKTPASVISEFIAAS